MFDRFFFGDNPVLHQLCQRCVQKALTLGSACLQSRFYLVGPVFPDEIGDCIVIDHYLKRCNLPPFIRPLHQSLGNHDFERLRQHSANLAYLIRWENTKQTIDGTDGVRCMQCRHDEMTGFSSGYSERDSFQVPQFANNDYVGVFPQSRS